MWRLHLARVFDSAQYFCFPFLTVYRLPGPVCWLVCSKFLSLFWQCGGYLAKAVDSAQQVCVSLLKVCRLPGPILILVCFRSVFFFWQCRHYLSKSVDSAEEVCVPLLQTVEIGVATTLLESRATYTSCNNVTTKIIKKNLLRLWSYYIYWWNYRSYNIIIIIKWQYKLPSATMTVSTRKNNSWKCLWQNKTRTSRNVTTIEETRHSANHFKF